MAATTGLSVASMVWSTSIRLGAEKENRVQNQNNSLFADYPPIEFYFRTSTVTQVHLHVIVFTPTIRHLQWWQHSRFLAQQCPCKVGVKNNKHKILFSSLSVECDQRVRSLALSQSMSNTKFFIPEGLDCLQGPKGFFA